MGVGLLLQYKQPASFEHLAMLSAQFYHTINHLRIQYESVYHKYIDQKQI